MDPNTQQPVQQPVQAPQQPQVASQPMPAGPVSPQTTVAQPPKKSNKKILVVLLIVLVLALVMGGLAYFYLMGNNSNTKNTNISASEGPPTKEQLSVSPTPEVSVNNNTQLDSAINEVNGVSTSTMEIEYNQAVTESKSL